MIILHPKNVWHKNQRARFYINLLNKYLNYEPYDIIQPPVSVYTAWITNFDISNLFCKLKIFLGFIIWLGRHTWINKWQNVGYIG